jgi:hypothetical protein
MKEPSKKRLVRIFEGVAEKMLMDFRQIQPQISHAGERGAQREETLKQFLEVYLPKKCGIGSGQIMNSRDSVSRQCDIVIYNALECPLLLTGKGYQLFPIESVLAVIEVKSSLNSKSIPECVENISSVKLLGTDEISPACCFFAYTTQFRGQAAAYKVARQLALLSKNIPQRNRFDTGCVLDSGMFFAAEDGIAVSESGASFNLLAFFMVLLRYLDLDRGSSYFTDYAQMAAPLVKIAPYGN